MSQSRDKLRADALRQLEQQYGHPLSAEELQEFEQWWQSCDRLVAEAEARFKAQEEARRNDPLLAFMQKLKDRQGTITPDFEALYRRKAELDGEKS